MSVKNELPMALRTPVSGHKSSRSLRLRLVVWYGTLLAVALAVFAVLVLLLVTTALNQSVESSVRVEQGVATLEVSRKLSSTPPYWPTHLSLGTIDRYLRPGIAIEIVDARGMVRYTSSGDLANRIPVSAQILQAILTGQPSMWYSSTVEGVRVQVEAVPIRTLASGGTTSTLTAGPVIGTLLVAKSLDNVESTLFLLQMLLLLSGIATLLATLLGGWIIAGTVLRPLAEIARTAGSVAAATARGTRIGDLSLRVRTLSKRDEMGQVVDTFNEMLSNLESATLIQRRFVADASHELGTTHHNSGQPCLLATPSERLATWGTPLTALRRARRNASTSAVGGRTLAAGSR